MKRFGRLILIIATLVIVGALIYFGWSWWDLKKQVNMLLRPEGIEELQKKQTEELLNKMKEHIVLPDGEDPIIATVTDAEALKRESNFYALAKNDDVVVIYVRAKKAFLYDPFANRVLNVGPVITDENSEGIEQDEDIVSVEVRNGTEVSGRGEEMAQQISNLDGNFKVLPATNADETYSETVIIDNGADAKLLAKVEAELGTTALTTVPEGERSSSAKILILIGE